MSSIITDKLKEIVNGFRDEKEVCSATSTETSSSDRRESSFQANDKYSALCKMHDRCSCEGYHIAKLWAAKLKKLRCEQRMYAEKAIHDVLFEAQLGNLHKSAVKINGACNNSQWTPSTKSNETHCCSYSSKSNNSTPICRSCRTFEAPTTTQCTDGSSSEVMITESFPNENGLIPSESQFQEQELASNHSMPINRRGKSKTNRGHKHGRNKTFAIAASPESVKVLSSSPSYLCQYGPANTKT